MYCAVFLLADGTYEREFLDYIPTSQTILDLEDSYSVYITNPSRDYYNNTERKSAKVISLY
jgi:hypothetical protein